MSNYEIIEGDCLEVMRGMADASVDAVITDPPYFLPAKHYATRSKWARSLSDLSIIEHFFGSVFSECRRVLKPDGALLVFCDGQSYPVMYVRAYRDFERITDLVWDKGVIGMGNGVRRQHELILAALPAGFAWQGWSRSVLNFPPAPKGEREHPAEKPPALLEHLINLVTKPGQTVLDPFVGGGSAGVACVNTGRHFVGIEREHDYAEIARRRIAAASQQPALEGVA